MTDNIETDHIPDAGKKVLGANNSANISDEPISGEGDSDNTKTEVKVHIRRLAIIAQINLKALRESLDYEVDCNGLDLGAVSDAEALISVLTARLSQSQERVKELEGRLGATPPKPTKEEVNAKRKANGRVPVCRDCDDRFICTMNCGPARGVDYWSDEALARREVL